MDEPLLVVDELRVQFESSRGLLDVLNGVSFSIRRGEVVGLVGETGSGKSMTAASVIGLVDAPGRIAGGSVRFSGNELIGKSADSMAAFRGKRIGTVPQHGRAALHPMLKVESQVIAIYRRQLGISKVEARLLMLKMFASVGLRDVDVVANSFPHQLSGGMAQRVLIAMAFGMAPELIIADEPTTGLDATVQLKVLTVLQALVRESGSSTLLITHDLGIVEHFCNRVVVMHAGQVVEDAPVAEFFKEAMHPYSVGLLNSLPGAVAGTANTIRILGDPVDLLHYPAGCAFKSRCPLAARICHDVAPELVYATDSHFSRCHRIDELRSINAGRQEPGA